MVSSGETSQMQLDVRIPIVIGVTGHRDLRSEDIPSLERRVREIFEEIGRRHPHSPIILLSALAAGADILAAKVALECGAELVAPLPMPIAEYRKDFTDDRSRRDFEELLGKATRSFELPLVAGNTLGNIAETGPHRDMQYALLAAYIARHSQILVALWDGVDSGKLGGVSSKIGYRLEGIPEPYLEPSRPLSQVETGPVYHILTPRISNPAPAGELFSLTKRYSDYWGGDTERADEAYGRILDRVDRYNADAARLAPGASTRILESRAAMITPDRERSLDPECRIMLSRYAVADVMALRFKRQRLIVLKLLFGLVIFGFLFFLLHLHFIKSPFCLLLYPFFLGLAALIYLWAKASECEYKHEDYRALADAMRVQFFWKVVGVDEEAADHYLFKHKGELEWIRYAVRAWSIPLCPGKVIGRPDYELALERWVNQEWSYFLRRSSEDRATTARLHGVSKALFVAGISAAVVLFAVELFFQHHAGYSAPDRYVRDITMIAISTSLAIAAVLQGYLEKAVLVEESKQYDRMGFLYGLAAKRLEVRLKNNELAAVRDTYRDLGKEALIENADWLLLHRARPLEVPNV